MRDRFVVDSALTHQLSRPAWSKQRRFQSRTTLMRDRGSKRLQFHPSPEPYQASNRDCLFAVSTSKLQKSQLFRRGRTYGRRIFQPENCRVNSEPRSISACRNPLACRTPRNSKLRGFDRNSFGHCVKADRGRCRLRTRKLQDIEVAASTGNCYHPTSIVELGFTSSVTPY
jgi:hypothetical protein